LTLTIGIWIALFTAPLWLGEWQLSELTQFLCYGLFAMSLAFVWGQAGLLCFGQAIFFGIGAYLMAVITKGMIPGVPDVTALGLLAAVLVPGLIAILAGALMFQGRGLSGAYFAIVTLCAALIAERAASHWAFIGGFNGLLDVPPLRIGLGAKPVEPLAPISGYYVMAGAAACAYGLLIWLERSPLGTALRAIRDNEVRTSYFGFNVASFKTLAFAASACPVRICVTGADRRSFVDRSAHLGGARGPRSTARRVSGCDCGALGRERAIRGLGLLLAPGAGHAVCRLRHRFSQRAAGSNPVAAAAFQDDPRGRLAGAVDVTMTSA
jgi:ribose/xylose/arabinose/galactoside ABC-type transport system permease subunit